MEGFINLKNIIINQIHFNTFGGGGAYIQGACKWQFMVIVLLNIINPGYMRPLRTHTGGLRRSCALSETKVYGILLMTNH